MDIRHQLKVSPTLGLKSRLHSHTWEESNLSSQDGNFYHQTLPAKYLLEKEQAVPKVKDEGKKYNAMK